MPQDNVQDIERADTVPPLPDAENDDLGASMIEEDDVAVEDRLETEDEQFKDEMDGETEDNTDDENESAPEG